MDNEKVCIKLPSGCNVVLSEKVHDECYCNFDDKKDFIFGIMINSGQYFPQIAQFVYVLISICKGYTSFKDIFLCNLLAGTWWTAFWFLFKLYKTPGINSICCFIGGNIFRFFLHFIAIAAVSLFVVGDWKVILYCLVGGFVTSIVKSILFVKFSSVKYNDEVATYVSKFRT